MSTSLDLFLSSLWCFDADWSRAFRSDHSCSFSPSRGEADRRRPINNTRNITTNATITSVETKSILAVLHVRRKRVGVLAWWMNDVSLIYSRPHSSSLLTCDGLGKWKDKVSTGRWRCRIRSPEFFILNRSSQGDSRLYDDAKEIIGSISEDFVVFS